MENNYISPCGSVSCSTFTLALKDFKDILGGKWRFPILFSLCSDEIGFNELKRKMEPITAKALMENLQDLEMNHLVERNPENMKYRSAEYSSTLSEVIMVMCQNRVDLCSAELPQEDRKQIILTAVKNIFKLISGKWRILILGYLSFGSKRFNDIKVTIEGISAKELTTNLNKMIELELIEKIPEDEGARFQYGLTEEGESFMPLFKEIVQWSLNHRERIKEAYKSDDVV